MEATFPIKKAGTYLFLRKALREMEVIFHSVFYVMSCVILGSSIGSVCKAEFSPTRATVDNESTLHSSKHISMEITRAGLDIWVLDSFSLGYRTTGCERLRRLRL